MCARYDLIKHILLLSLLVGVPFATEFEVSGLKSDSTNFIVVDSIEYVVGDAFDDANYSTSIEKWAYNLLNKVHIKTRTSVLYENLSFEIGDSITVDDLRDSERILRKRKYISDAAMSYYTDANGKNIIRVKTSDHWSTTPHLSFPYLQFGSGDLDFAFSAGLIEWNLLGSGQKVGLIYSSGLERDMFYFEYENPHMLIKNHRLKVFASKNSDGYYYSSEIQRPFASIKDRWSYVVGGASSKMGKSMYKHPERNSIFTELDSNTFTGTGNDFSTSLATKIYSYSGIKRDSINIRIARKFGTNFQKIVGLAYAYSLERGGVSSRMVYHNVYGDEPGSNWAIKSNLIEPIRYTENSLIGIKFTLLGVKYAKVRNFNNVKYNEDVELGWSAYTGIFKNIEALNASTDSWLIKNKINFADVWALDHMFNLGMANRFYYDDKVYDGQFDSEIEYMWKPNSRTATYLLSKFNTLYRSPKYNYYTLDGISGMAGVPFFYYTGQTRVLFKVEERFFLPKSFERGTVVPVIATFFNAGNAYETFSDVDLNELRYNVGFGLRLGMSKSTQGVVQHVDVAWPLNGPLKDGSWKTGFGARVSIVAMLSL